MNASVAQYREHAVLTAPPERLVVLLYQGACRFLAQAAAAMEERNIEEANRRLQRAEAIIDELRNTLNPEAGEITDNLREIYSFCLRHLMRARIKQDAKRINEIRTLLADLGEAWAQITGA